MVGSLTWPCLPETLRGSAAEASGTTHQNMNGTDSGTEPFLPDGEQGHAHAHTSDRDDHAASGGQWRLTPTKLCGDRCVRRLVAELKLCFQQCRVLANDHEVRGSTLETAVCV